eukprot:1624587-Amphidinium_carterae.1
MACDQSCSIGSSSFVKRRLSEDYLGAPSHGHLLEDETVNHAEERHITYRAVTSAHSNMLDALTHTIHTWWG